MDKLRHKESPAKSAALIGIMAATIECVKIALAAIPNVGASLEKSKQN